MHLRDREPLRVTGSLFVKLTELADKHAPINIKTITERPEAEWYTTELEQEKRLKRKLERRYRCTCSSEDAQGFSLQCALYSDMLLSTRRAFYTNKIEYHAGDQKALFKVFNKLMHRTNEQQLPAHDDLGKLTNRFGDFFYDKIENIHMNILSKKNANSARYLEETSCCTCAMSEFQAVTEEDVEKSIRKSPTKSCTLDPIPTWLLKDCLGPLLPVITKLINLSMSEGIMPEDFKDANLLPLLKKSQLDIELLKNFRPISNLAYISKLIEKIVDIQMTTHMTLNDLHDIMQSSYKENYSTETAILRMQNDILTALDQNKAVLIICIDLSAAFDTVDHEILLNRLEKRIGITHTCLKWFRSYLSNRKQTVVINGVKSSSRNLTCSVPQGSVLGPKLYNIYTLPIGDLVKKHKVQRMLYADDSHLYACFKPMEANVTRIQMETLAADLNAWFIANNLMSNDDKLVAMLINGPRHKPIIFPLLTVSDVQVPLSDSTHALGVEVDNTMSMVKQVNSVTKSCFFQLHRMYKIRECITEDAAKTMVHALVTSKLDYCNSLLYGLPDILLNKLWSVQKSAARLITMSGKYQHISPTMEKLHWLPVWQRIEYKVLLLTYKALNGLAPVYLSDLLQLRVNRGSRRDNTLLLVDPKINRVTFGGRAFCKAAPVLWNSIPPSLRTSASVTQFKKNLKTYLYHKTYNCSC